MRMKPVAVLYATREGHTRRVAERVGAGLRRRGLEPEVREVAPEVDLQAYGSAILAASVHAGLHEKEMVAFVTKHRSELERIPAAFLSVSLSEAGAELPSAPPEKRAQAAADAQGMIDVFLTKTGWHPARVKPIAGALPYTRYNFLIRFVMKRIARKAGATTDTSRDHEFTDWESLERFIDSFVADLPGAATPSPGSPESNAPHAPC